MSTDPKKLIKTIVLAYILACVILISGYTCKDVPVLIISFSFISVMLFVSGILSLHQNYKKYHIQMYFFLEIVGFLLTLFSVIMCLLCVL